MSCNITNNSLHTQGSPVTWAGVTSCGPFPLVSLRLCVAFIFWGLNLAVMILIAPIINAKLLCNGRKTICCVNSEINYNVTYRPYLTENTIRKASRLMFRYTIAVFDNNCTKHINTPVWSKCSFFFTACGIYSNHWAVKASIKWGTARFSLTQISIHHLIRTTSCPRISRSVWRQKLKLSNATDNVAVCEICSCASLSLSLSLCQPWLFQIWYCDRP